MRITFNNPATGDTVFDMTLNPSQEEFWNAQDRFVLVSGGLGCIGGETRIETREGLRTVLELYEKGQSFYVRNKYGTWSLALPPVRYEPKQLYRVTTDEGSFIATADHRVMNAYGHFVPVSQSSVGDVLRASSSLPRSNSVCAPSILFVNVLRLMQRVRGSLSYCRSLFRLCGGRLLSLLGISPASSPLPDGVHESTRTSWSYSCIPHEDGRIPEQACTRPCPRYDHHSTHCSYSQAVLPSLPVSTRNGEVTFGRISLIFLSVWKFLMTFSLEVGRVGGSISRMFFGDGGLGTYPKSTKILSIIKERVDCYYDFHVVGNHSYVAEGHIHHNSGKSVCMILRIIYECMSQDNNYFLVGRATYQEIHDVLIKEFFEICPEPWVKEYTKTPHPRLVLNTFSGGTSEIIFRNLDKMSKGELLGLNLGGFAIDQAEDIPEEVFLTLKGRLRRKGITHRVFMTSNPKLSWLYRAFKQNPEDNYRLIECSTLENEKNLPPEYVADLLKYPPSWVKQYVEGVWDESLLADNTVFAREFIEELSAHVRDAIRSREGFKIFRDYVPGHHYRMGIDSAEGTDTIGDDIRKTPKDSGVISIWDHTANEEVACYTGKIPPRVLAEKAVLGASWYGSPEMIPEMNSMGLALIDKLDELGYTNIYRREEYDRVLKKSLKKVGWRTTSSSKQLLISRFEEKLRLTKPRVYSKVTVEEMKTFVYTDNAKKKGAGAMDGFHDDHVMALLMAAFDDKPITSTVTHSGENYGSMNIPTVPSIRIVNGRYVPPDPFSEKGRTATWNTL